MGVHIVVWFRSIPAFWIAGTSDDGQVICGSAALSPQFIIFSTRRDPIQSQGSDAPSLWINFRSKPQTHPLLITLLSPHCTQLRKGHKSAFFGGCDLKPTITFLKVTRAVEWLGFQLNGSACPSLQAPLIFYFPSEFRQKKASVTFRIASLKPDGQF